MNETQNDTESDYDIIRLEREFNDAYEKCAEAYKIYDAARDAREACRLAVETVKLRKKIRKQIIKELLAGAAIQGAA